MGRSHATRIDRRIDRQIDRQSDRRVENPTRFAPESANIAGQFGQVGQVDQVHLEPVDTNPNKQVALVVDDDPLVRRALARQLRRDFCVRLAGSQAEALTILTECARAGPSGGKGARAVALAFVDFELPDGTGELVLRRLEAWPDAISVLMSANVAEMRRFRSCGALVALVLDKPLAWSSVEAAKKAALSVPRA